MGPCTQPHKGCKGGCNPKIPPRGLFGMGGLCQDMGTPAVVCAALPMP